MAGRDAIGGARDGRPTRRGMPMGERDETVRAQGEQREDEHQRVAPDEARGAAITAPPPRRLSCRGRAYRPQMPKSSLKSRAPAR